MLSLDYTKVLLNCQDAIVDKIEQKCSIVNDG